MRKTYSIFAIGPFGGANYITSMVEGKDAADALVKYGSSSVGRLYIKPGTLCFLIPVNDSGVPVNPNGAQCVYRLQETNFPPLEAVAVNPFR